jgi:hypothetical protein
MEERPARMDNRAWRVWRAGGFWRFLGFWFLSLSVLCGFLFFNFDENLPPIG